jgi:hypothetical protein
MYPSRWQRAKKKKKLLNKNSVAKKKNSVPMKGVFWSCRGLPDLAKHTFFCMMWLGIIILIL